LRFEDVIDGGDDDGVCAVIVCGFVAVAVAGVAGGAGTGTGPVVGPFGAVLTATPPPPPSKGPGSELAGVLEDSFSGSATGAVMGLPVMGLLLVLLGMGSSSNLMEEVL